VGNYPKELLWSWNDRKGREKVRSEAAVGRMSFQAESPKKKEGKERDTRLNRRTKKNKKRLVHRDENSRSTFRSQGKQKFNAWKEKGGKEIADWSNPPGNQQTEGMRGGPRQDQGNRKATSLGGSWCEDQATEKKKGPAIVRGRTTGSRVQQDRAKLIKGKLKIEDTRLQAADTRSGKEERSMACWGTKKKNRKRGRNPVISHLGRENTGGKKRVGRGKTQ